MAVWHGNQFGPAVVIPSLDLTGFEYSNKVVGYIKGYRRVFWQGSTDHRGTPEAPGRTVTLHEEEGALTWGVAYQIAGTEQEQQQTIQYLEWREKQYDIRRLCNIYTADSADQAVVQDVLVYIASDSPNNVNWLGPASLPDIAVQIATSHGPSGRNCEYLFRLADAMREIKVEDAELFELEALVKSIMAEGGSDMHLGAPSTAAATSLVAAGVGKLGQHAIQVSAVAAVASENSN